jgi:aspartate/methionine/tyrosine aminotransferase
MDKESVTNFTDRARAVEPFLAMEILEKAGELERAGAQICHLEVGEPDFPTPQVIVEAGIQAIRNGETRYTHSLGMPELREAIARTCLERYGASVDPGQVLVTMGSSPAFLYVFGALLEAGDEVIVAAPHYSCYPNFVRYYGGKMVSVPTDPDKGYCLDADDVKKRLTPRTKAILINSPANPTGAVLDADTLRSLADLDVPVVSDEIYHGLVYEGDEHSMLEYSSDAYVLNGFSKRFAMTGWRLGYLIVPHHSVRTMQNLQQNFSISANAFVQRAGIAALEQAGPDIERMRQTYDRRRRLMVDVMREAGLGIKVMPRGAFYVFADVSAYTDDSLRFAFEILEQAHVGVTPGVDYGKAGRQAIRLSYAASDDTIREAARRIGSFLADR